MPVFEYECSDCQHIFAAYVRSFEQRDIKRSCPKCSGQGSYGGISQVTMGRWKPFGLIMDDGTRVRGKLRRD